MILRFYNKLTSEWITRLIWHYTKGFCVFNNAIFVNDELLAWSLVGISDTNLRLVVISDCAVVNVLSSIHFDKYLANNVLDISQICLFMKNLLLYFNYCDTFDVELMQIKKHELFIEMVARKVGFFMNISLQQLFYKSIIKVSIVNNSSSVRLQLH